MLGQAQAAAPRAQALQEFKARVVQAARLAALEACQAARVAQPVVRVAQRLVRVVQQLVLPMAAAARAERLSWRVVPVPAATKFHLGKTPRVTSRCTRS
jgi:hypothetical protein